MNKNIVLLFLFLSSIYCTNHSVRGKEFKFNLKSLYSTNVVDSASIGFTENSIIILGKFKNEGLPYAAYEHYSFTFQTDSLKITTDIKEISGIELTEIESQIQKAPVQFNDILHPDIKYEIANRKTKIPAYDNLECKKILAHKHASYQYFVCQGLTKEIFIYDQADNLIHKQQIFDIPTVVRDFFLHDITGDNVPEVIILSESHLVRDEKIIVLEIFSLENSET